MTENEAKLTLDVRISRFDHADDVNKALEVAKTALEEIQQYREIGTVDDFKRLDYLKRRYEDETYDYCGEYGTRECGAESRLEMLNEYEAIGMVEECKAAIERQRAKKPIKDEHGHDCCPNCGWIVCYDEWGGRYLPHCENCGQAIDWSE